MEANVSQPTVLLLMTIVWTEGIENFSNSFDQIFLSFSVAEVLNELGNKHAVHSVVTVDGGYQSADAVEASDLSLPTLR